MWRPAYLRLNREGMSLLKKLLLPWGLTWEGEPNPWVGLWEFIWVMVAATGLLRCGWEKVLRVGTWRMKGWWLDEEEEEVRGVAM